MEIWEATKRNKMYCVSSMGRIWSAKSGVLKTPLNNCGYPHFNILIDGKPIRTLENRAFMDTLVYDLKTKMWTITYNNHFNDDVMPTDLLMDFLENG